MKLWTSRQFLTISISFIMNLTAILSNRDILQEILHWLYDHNIFLLMSTCTDLHNINRNTMISLNELIRHCSCEEFIHFEKRLKKSGAQYFLQSYGRWDILTQLPKYACRTGRHVQYDIDNIEDACKMYELGLTEPGFIDEIIRKQYLINDFQYTNGDIYKVIGDTSDFFSLVYETHKETIHGYLFSANMVRMSCRNHNFCLKHNIKFGKLTNVTLIVSSFEDAEYYKLHSDHTRLFCNDMFCLKYMYNKNIIDEPRYISELDFCKCDMSNVENFDAAKSIISGRKLQRLLIISGNLCDEAFDYYYKKYMLKNNIRNNVINMMEWTTTKYFKRMVEIHNYIPTPDDILEVIRYSLHDVAIYLLSIMKYELLEPCMTSIITRVIKNDDSIILKYIANTYDWQFIKDDCLIALRNDSFNCFVYLCKKLNITRRFEIWETIGPDCHVYMDDNMKHV